MCRYDNNTKRWTFLADMKESRSDFSLIWAERFLYAIGGDTENDTVSTVEYYNENIDQWTETTSMPTARSAMGTALFGNHIYVLGGLSSNSDELNVVERYDLRTHRWTKVCNKFSFKCRNIYNFECFFKFECLIHIRRLHH